ncbi:class I SAM-dependent methyltransferase [Streptomyces sp. NPDC007861]|uniref:class I SAM-dependent methyltransferase n=1 Tax=Streptomyces sp. NPDC007861 TaxID=3154893 RepID=UPI0033E168DE
MPTPPSTDPKITGYYQIAFDESARLSGPADGVLEMVRTQELLRSHLPAAPATVLDVGGGPGAHARWLAEDGYSVHVVDPVPRHVEQAAAIRGVTSERGDARALSAADDSYDAALLLGPLYHLLERDDRLRALREAARVVRPGCLIAAAAIGRYASVLEHTATTLLATHEPVRDSVRKILQEGRYVADKGFTDAAFHTADELTEELREVGLEGIVVYGVEGPAWAAVKAAELHSGGSVTGSALFQAALTAARLADPYPELLAAASHLLAVAHTPA